MSPCNAPLRDWQGRRVWLVGASSGIGQALAEALHAAGARVVVSSRQATALQAFVDAHPGAQAVPLDVCQSDAVVQAVHEVLREPLDVLVYCAGHYVPMRASDASLAELERHLDVNYRGALRVLSAALPYLGAGMHVSLMASVAAYRGLPKSLAYGPTKAALMHLAEVLYLDLAPRGIGVSVINPGFVATPLTAQNEFHMPALISPQQAAQAILQGWAKGEFDIHFPKRFTFVMKLLRLLPYRLYFAAVHRITGL